MKITKIEIYMFSNNHQLMIKMFVFHEQCLAGVVCDPRLLVMRAQLLTACLPFSLCEVREELEEFQVSSHELEEELEAQLEQAEAKGKELTAANYRLQVNVQALRVGHHHHRRSGALTPPSHHHHRSHHHPHTPLQAGIQPYSVVGTTMFWKIKPLV